MQADSGTECGEIDLSDSDMFFQGYLAGWRDGRRRRIATGATNEPDITAVICALQGPAGDAAIDFLLTCAGIPAEAREPGRHEFRHGGDLDHLRNSPDTGRPLTEVQPDVFISHVPIDGPTRLVVAVEVKKDAPVNYVACPAGIHESYSNQVICYPNGCWLPPSPQVKDIRYVWLARERDITSDRFPRHALNDRDMRQEWLVEAGAWQAESAHLWHRASLEAFSATIAPHAPAVARLVLRWLG